MHDTCTRKAKAGKWFACGAPSFYQVSSVFRGQQLLLLLLEPNPLFCCVYLNRWVDLYGEEICEANTHINFKKQSDAPATVTYAMDSQRKQPVEVMKSFNNLHGSGFVRESLRGVPPAPGSVGLHNLGNSCYMNSILQCVNHISPITQYFLKGEYVKHVNKNNPLGSGGRVGTCI